MRVWHKKRCVPGFKVVCAAKPPHKSHGTQKAHKMTAESQMNPQHSQTENAYDLFVIGGGINGCGIARDAAGRGLRVALAEMGDLAGATSSASTKLFHGGLRYLEYFEIGLVRKALVEREVLLANMPHIARPMRFVFPLSPDMRFDATTPASRVLGFFMPWLRGRRPGWMIRLGLFLYDRLGGRKYLPGTKRLDLTRDAAGMPLKEQYRTAFEYSDCVVDDARLVVLNAVDAARRGARIMVRTKVVHAERAGQMWRVEMQDRATGAREVVHARALVNATGPWVEEVVHDALGTASPADIRLVQGSHIVVPRLYDHGRAYYLQGPDGRLVFMIPFHDRYTLIGTTETPVTDPDQPPRLTEEELDYLLRFTGRYLRKPLARDQVVWSFSGVRPLFDEHEGSATSATRDYRLILTGEPGAAPALHVFGGKITTYRVLAEGALARLADTFPEMGAPWTRDAPLPGGDFAVDGVEGLVAELRGLHPFLSHDEAERLVAAYGTDASLLLKGARARADLGVDFGAGLSEREVRWMIDREFARDLDDIIWRRSKLGLDLTEAEARALAGWLAHNVGQGVAP